MRTLRGNWVYYKWRAKIALLQLYHRFRPDLHQFRWVGIMECGCCGFEGLSCEVCNQHMIIGDCADAYISPDGLTAGRWYESGY